MEPLYFHQNLHIWREKSLLKPIEYRQAYELLQNKAASFNLLSEKARGDKELAFYGVSFFSWNILYCSPQLQLDWDLLTISLLEEPKILFHLSGHVKNDLKFALHILTLDLERTQIKDGNYKRNIYADNPFFKDNIRSCFQYFSSSVRKNIELIKLALQIDYRNYQFISNALRQKESIASFALNVNPLCFSLFNDKLKNNPKLCKEAVFLHSDIIDLIPNKQITPEIIIEAVSKNPLNNAYIPDAFLENKDVAIACVKNNGIYLKELPKHFRNDFDVVTTAIASSVKAISFAGIEFEKYVKNFEKEHSPQNEQDWQPFLNYFISHRHADLLREKLEKDRTFNFDNPALNTIETEDDLYTDTDGDSGGSQSSGTGHSSKSKTTILRKI